MHPPPSMIVFTVLTGLGLGMIAWIGLGLGSESHLFGWIAGPLSLAIAGIGGAASLGHLARPDRAWRAFSQWRSSWLSREACLMIAAKVTFLAYLALWLLLDIRIAALGWLAAALCGATVYATAMIYAQLRTVPRWSATPTPHLFLVLSLTGGVLGGSAIKAAIGLDVPTGYILVWLIVATAVAIWWQTQAAGARRGFHGSSAETATGLSGLGQVRLLEPPHTGSNYLLKEMAYKVGRQRAFQLRKLAAFLGFATPVLLAVLAYAFEGLDFAAPFLILALISHLVGITALRWLFFAEAEHVQALYYGVK
ncbi:MAG: dimethyl sulfoxide reductase anchor subunit family protein [Paracoccaceae bacterium]